MRESIGSTRLRDVDAGTLDVFVRWLRREHPGAETAHVRAYAILQASLRCAARRGLIAADPTLTSMTRAPKLPASAVSPCSRPSSCGCTAGRPGVASGWRRCYGAQSCPASDAASCAGSPGSTST